MRNQSKKDNKLRNNKVNFAKTVQIRPILLIQLFTILCDNFDLRTFSNITICQKKHSQFWLWVGGLSWGQNGRLALRIGKDWQGFDIDIRPVKNEINRGVILNYVTLLSYQFIYFIIKYYNFICYMLRPMDTMPPASSHNNQPHPHESAISRSKNADSCNVSHADRAEIKKQIIFMEEKYDKLKKKLYQKKLLGQLSEQDVQEIANIMNIIAMKYSQDGQNKVAEEWLRRALKHGQVSQRVKIVTYNNMACVYKQANDLPLALFYINKAQKQADCFCLEMQDDRLMRVVTDCSLNLCAILSAMGEHYKALRAARKALLLLESSQNLPDSYFQSLFPIVKYNQGVELERLKMYQEAEEAYLAAQQSPMITCQLSQRLKKAIQSIKILNQKKKQKQYQSIKQPGKRVRLSLPKFCPSEQNSISVANSKKKSKMSIKMSISKNSGAQNLQHYMSTGNKVKVNKLTIQNYHSLKSTVKTTARSRSGALKSIQNF